MHDTLAAFRIIDVDKLKLNSEPAPPGTMLNTELLDKLVSTVKRLPKVPNKWTAEVQPDDLERHREQLDSMVNTVNRMLATTNAEESVHEDLEQRAELLRVTLGKMAALYSTFKSRIADDKFLVQPSELVDGLAGVAEEPGQWRESHVEVEDDTGSAGSDEGSLRSHCATGGGEGPRRLDRQQPH